MRYDIKINFKGIKSESVGWIRVAQDRNQCRALVNMATNLQVPLNAENFMTI
jgi:hypothetical protein